MTAPPVSSVVPSRLYSLRGVEARFQICPEDIIRYAAEAQISVCVLIPPNKRAYHVNLENIDWDFTRLDVEFSLRNVIRKSHTADLHAKPDTWPLPAPVSTLALVVDERTCDLVDLFGYQRRRFFAKAIQFHEGMLGIDEKRLALVLQSGQVVVNENDDHGKGKKSGRDRSYDPFRFGLYVGDFQFSEVRKKGFALPEELEISANTLYILGDQLNELLMGLGIQDYKLVNQDPSEPLANGFPPPVKNLIVPTFASARLKEFCHIANLRWSHVDPGLSQAEYDSINASVVEDLRKAKAKIPLAEDQIETAAGIIRPLWARRGLSPAIKNSRLETFVTPDLEKILLVARRIYEWKSSRSDATRDRYSRLHPSDKLVIGWLADSEHYSVSATHKAPVAAKLLRSEPGARRATASRKSKRVPASKNKSL